MFFYDYYSIFLILPLIILSLIIQHRLNLTYKKYSKIMNSKNVTGCAIAKMILANAGINDVTIECIEGNLTDRFIPTRKVIQLSQNVYNGTSISAIGIAAHETGHALQYEAQYFPIKLRSSIIGVTSFSSNILYLVIILSLFTQMPLFCNIAVFCFMVLFIFNLVTLPVEFNASARAVENIRNMGYNDTDIAGVKKVLTAAAMTYVIAMLISLAQMLAYILRTNSRK